MEKDKGLVYDVSWRAGSQKSTKEKKNKENGMSLVAGKGMSFTEGMWKRDVGGR